MKNYEEIGKIKINGDEWSYGWADLGKKVYGKCIYTKQTIAFNREQRCSLSNVVSHEVIHAFIPFLYESQVEKLGNIIGEICDNLSQSEPSR
jgi:hypothetical protein